MVIGCLYRFCLSMSVVWDIVCSELGQGTTGYLVECCFVYGVGVCVNVCGVVCVVVWCLLCCDVV